MWCESCSVMFNSLRPHGLYSPWNSPGQNPGVGCLSLLQGIFPTQGSNPGLPHCRQILCQLSHTGSPRILEWVAYPFSSGSSQPRNRTRVSGIAGGFFTNWASREAWVAFDFALLDICMSHGCLQSGLSWRFQVSALIVSPLACLSGSCLSASEHHLGLLGTPLVVQ